MHGIYLEEKMSGPKVHSKKDHSDPAGQPHLENGRVLDVIQNLLDQPGP